MTAIVLFNALVHNLSIAQIAKGVCVCMCVHACACGGYRWNGREGKRIMIHMAARLQFCSVIQHLHLNKSKYLASGLGRVWWCLHAETGGCAACAHCLHRVEHMMPACVNA